MSLQTYDDLRAAIADWLMRDDLNDPIRSFVTMAEADISRRLAADDSPGQPPREMMGYAQSPISQEFETTPPDFMGARAAFIEGQTHSLDFSTVEEIAKRKALYPSACGNPRAYAVIGEMFQFWPAPASQLQISLFYIQRIQKLTPGIQVNWLLKMHPDCYLYGSLLHSAPYLKDDERIATWQACYDRSIASIRMAAQRTQQASYLSLAPRAVA